MSITNETYKAMTPQKTKLIISVSPREITESLSRELIKAQPNGISIIFDPSFEEKIPLVSQFVRNIRKNTSHPLAVCIDVTKQTRATIDKSENHESSHTAKKCCSANLSIDLPMESRLKLIIGVSFSNLTREFSLGIGRLFSSSKKSHRNA